MSWSSKNWNNKSSWNTKRVFGTSSAKVQNKEKFISEERKVKFISDVDSQVPEKLKKLFCFIEEVIGTDKKTILKVYEKIKKS